MLGKVQVGKEGEETAVPGAGNARRAKNTRKGFCVLNLVNVGEGDGGISILILLDLALTLSPVNSLEVGQKGQKDVSFRFRTLNLLSCGSSRSYLRIPLLLKLADGQETILEVKLEAIYDHIVGRSDQQNGDLCILISSVERHL